MPREPWRDDPEYVSLWRAARQTKGADARLVLADWLEEHGHTLPAWMERLHGLTGQPPEFDEDADVLSVGVLSGEAWRRLVAAPPSDDLLVSFWPDPVTYRWLPE